MFNRALQVKMIKDKKMHEMHTSDTNFVERAVYAQEIMKDIVKEGMKLVATYILLDTLRRVVVAKFEQ